jgi:hypothetical protein
MSTSGRSVEHWRNLVALAALAFCGAVGCSGSDHPTTTDLDHQVAPAPTTTSDPCATSNEGCPCTEPGKKASCKATIVRAGTFEYCGGERTCDPATSKWGPCESSLNYDDGDGGLTNAAH